MSSPQERADARAAAKAAAKASTLWPFDHRDHRPLVGWQLAQQHGAEKFHLAGHGQVGIPSMSEAMTIYAYDDVTRRCSCPDNRKIGAPAICKHGWWYRFAAGDLKDAGHEPTGELLQRANVYFVNAKRKPIPNPVVRGVREATRKLRALGTLEQRVPVLLRMLCDRFVQPFPPKRGRGQPEIDLSDLAFAVVMMRTQKYSYARLKSMIEEWHRRGWIRHKKPFHPNVVCAAAGTKAMRERLAAMLEAANAPLADVETLILVDATDMPTGRTENARAKKRNVRISYAPNLVWFKYNLAFSEKFGAVVAIVPCWNKGLGSADVVHYPALAKAVRRVYKRGTIVVGDNAYGSERNHVVSERLGVRLVTPVKRNWKPETKKMLGPEKARAIKEFAFRNDGRDHGEIYCMRPKAETYNNVFKTEYQNHVSSRPHQKRRKKKGESAIEEAARDGAPPIAEEPRAAEPPDFAFPIDPKKADPDDVEALFGHDESERERILAQVQNVGNHVWTEGFAIALVMTLRALNRAEQYYDDEVDFESGRRFRPIRPEERRDTA